jgi:hypothetical protein
MTAAVEIDGRAVLMVTLSSELLDWLHVRRSRGDTFDVDEYRDVHVSKELLLQWLVELKRVVDEEVDALRKTIAGRLDLPKDVNTRDRITGQLAQKAIREHIHLPALGDLIAAMDLALETGAAFRLYGD